MCNPCEVGYNCGQSCSAGMEDPWGVCLKFSKSDLNVYLYFQVVLLFPMYM